MRIEPPRLRAPIALAASCAALLGCSLYDRYPGGEYQRYLEWTPECIAALAQSNPTCDTLADTGLALRIGADRSGSDLVWRYLDAAENRRAVLEHWDPSEPCANRFDPERDCVAWYLATVAAQFDAPRAGVALALMSLDEPSPSERRELPELRAAIEFMNANAPFAFTSGALEHWCGWRTTLAGVARNRPETATLVLRDDEVVITGLARWPDAMEDSEVVIAGMLAPNPLHESEKSYTTAPRFRLDDWHDVRRAEAVGWSTPPWSLVDNH